MKIFVTGCESFVGKELLRQCERKGIEVYGLDVVPSQKPYCHVGDITSPEIALKIPEGCDALIHLAALSRDKDCKGQAWKCFQINVMGTLNMIEAAQKRGVKQFIFASSEWVYDSFVEGKAKTEDDPIDLSRLASEYALSKLVSEANLRQRFQQGSCPVTILRFGIIYGPRQDNWSAVESLLKAVASQEEVTVGSLNTGRSFIHVTDICEAILASVGLKDFQIINIQGGRMVTLRDVIETAKTILNRHPKIVERTPQQVSQRLVSNEKAKKLMHWQARIGLTEGLADVAEFLKLTEEVS